MGVPLQSRFILRLPDASIGGSMRRDFYIFKFANSGICSGECAVNAFKDIVMIQIQKNVEKQDAALHDYSEVVVAKHNGTVFFATPQPKDKVYRHTPEKDEFFMPLAAVLKRFTSESHAWFASHCQHNASLNRLVDRVIYNIQTDVVDFQTTDKPPLVIFDIDETILSMYYAFVSYFQSLQDPLAIVSRIPVFEQGLYPDQITIIRPIQRLYHALMAKGANIAFVTGRPEGVTTRLFTERQIKDIGYADNKGVFMCPLKWNGSIASWKEHARQELSKNFQIVMSIDDDWKNLQGANVGNYAVWVPSKLDQWGDEGGFFKKLKES